MKAVTLLYFIGSLINISLGSIKEATGNETLEIESITLIKNSNTTAFLEPLFNSSRIAGV